MPAVVAVAMLLAFPSGALADHTDSFATARDGQADLLPDEATFDDNVGFSSESGEALVCGTSTYGSTAWFRFRAERSGMHTITTLDSSFDTVLSVYRPASGGAIPDLGERIACRDDFDDVDRTSFVDFTAQAGQTYYAQVGGYDDGGGASEGDIVITAFQPPANDNRANAEPIGAGGGVQGFNFNAGTETGETRTCGTSAYGATTWYRATAPAIGDATVSVVSTDMDPVVAVYPAGSSRPIACNDDAPGQTRSAVVTGRVAPGEYLIQVGGYESEVGTYEVRVSFVEDTDLDDDRIPRDRDCNDNDPNIRPGVPELVNNDVDENCDGVREFDRDGDGSRVPGNPGDCDDGDARRSPIKPEIPGNDVDENCDGVVAPFPIVPSRVSAVFKIGPPLRLKTLTLVNARRGSTLTVRCRGRGCRFRKKTVRVRRNARELVLTKRFPKRQRVFKPKQRLILRVGGPGWSPREKIYTMRKGKFPRFEEYCITDAPRKC